MSDEAKRQIRTASHYWSNLVNYSRFTLYYTKKSEWTQIVDRFEQYDRPILLSLKKNIIRQLPDIMEQLTRLTNLTGFEARWIDCSNKSAFTFTCLTNLRWLSYNIIQEAPYYMWKGLTKLEMFNIRFKLVPVIQWHEVTAVISTLVNLRDLSIQSFTEVNNPFAVITESHSNLTCLKIDHSFAADWTEADLFRLRRLKKLEFIITKKENYTTDKPLSLKHLTALEFLRSNLPIAEAEHCTRLTMLDRKMFTAQDKQMLAYLPQLKDLGELKVTNNLEFLSILTALERLWLDGAFMNPQEEVNPILKYIASTKITSLIGVSLLTYVDWQYVSRLASIHELSIMNTVCDHHVLLLTNLTSLSFYGMFEGEDNFLLPYLPKLTNLRALLYGPVSTSDTPVDLSPLTNLEKLDLHIDAACFTGFGAITNLTRLSLLSEEEDDQGYQIMPYLTNFTKLVHLDLAAVPSDAIKYLTALTNLNVLELHRLDDDKELLCLTAMTNLSTLRIQNTSSNMTGIYLTMFSKLHLLTFKSATPEVINQLPNLVFP